MDGGVCNDLFLKPVFSCVSLSSSVCIPDCNGDSLARLVSRANHNRGQVRTFCGCPSRGRDHATDESFRNQNVLKQSENVETSPRTDI